MNKSMFADVKVGDRVWDSRQGWGVITELNDWSVYPITVEFVRDCETYTLDGYYDEDDVNPSLFWDEIEIKAPPKPLPELEVDAKVLVWVSPEHKHRRHFSHFASNGDINTFDAGSTSFSRLHAASVTAWPFWEVAE